MNVTRKEVLHRAGVAWFWLTYVALFSYLDWITHREIAFIVIVGGGVAALILFRPEIVKKLNLDPQIRKIPGWARPFVFALPGIAYFLIRGQGTSGAGPLVVLASFGAVAAFTFFGAPIDQRLGRYYAIRNKILPSWARYPLAIVLPIFVAFFVIHGHITDIPAMWGGTTAHRKSPVGLEYRFFLAALLSAGAAFLMVRESEIEARHSAVALEASGAVEVAPPAAEAPAPHRPASTRKPAKAKRAPARPKPKVAKRAPARRTRKAGK